MEKDEFLYNKVIVKLEEDIKKVEDLIEAQFSFGKYRECPLYQDVIDTQIFGLSKEIELAIEIGALSKTQGREILEKLENKLEQEYSQNIRKAN